ncbi:D-2-hydroxyacid dehydrogenase [Helicobacter sp. MIT 99-5507]|uniref:D-2-hydroxyacid dehydrogenase n=1 Tax=Helicobacter sp. MIT 99-5507 TaxID=152489 RepID=UPI000E1E81B8|nr:D-2-hydroxyacid dehydrogenase [Helicobacter sp. MIT 99-5507]RDU57563.1 D-2-hydroxyacid dehydrogenase [Helicobacter sp. MIT 99-5507]
MNIVLLDAQTLGNDRLDSIAKLGNFKSYDVTKADEVLERVKDADIVLTNKVVLDKNILEKLPKLKLICITATGMNNIDLECAKKLNIEVKNVANYSTQSVAQHTLMMVLNLIAKQNYYDDFVKSGKWAESAIFTHINNNFELYDLENKNWSIIGFGNIGQKVAKLASAFGANVKYYSTSGNNNNANFERISNLKDLLENSDIITIHAPLNQTTKNLITKKELALLKKDSILINVGRGGIVNENDVASALKDKDFYYGCDVLEFEPMIKNHPFLDKNIWHKLLLSPHIAWAYKESRKRLIEGVEKNIMDFINKD